MESGNSLDANALARLQDLVMGLYSKASEWVQAKEDTGASVLAHIICMLAGLQLNMCFISHMDFLVTAGLALPQAAQIQSLWMASSALRMSQLQPVVHMILAYSNRLSELLSHVRFEDSGPAAANIAKLLREAEQQGRQKEHGKEKGSKRSDPDGDNGFDPLTDFSEET
jgi:hypothetical protein